MEGWADTSPHHAKGPLARRGIGIPEILVFAVLLTSFFVKGTAGEDKPVPYDLLMIATMGGFFLFGLRFPVGVAWPASFWGLILLGYGIGGMGAVYMDRVQSFMMICAYLVCSLLFFASFVYQDVARRMTVIFWAYTIAALIAASIAIGAYFGLLSQATFLHFGRAASTFNDPNVYGPFLVAPILFLSLRLSSARSMRELLYVPLVFVLLLGILLSFSRGAWGNLVLSAAIFFCLTLATSKSAKQSTRLIIFAAGMALLVAIVLIIALSTPQVAVLFTERASLMQDYDAGQGGRFDTQLLALKSIFENPLGIGPSQWAMVHHLDTHNVYLNIGVAGGFLSGLAFVGFVLVTMWRGAKACMVDMPGQDLLIVAYAVTMAHFAEALIIDVDNWRHLFLLMGMSWGGILAADVVRRRARDKKPQRQPAFGQSAVMDGFPG